MINQKVSELLQVKSKQLGLALHPFQLEYFAGFEEELQTPMPSGIRKSL